MASSRPDKDREALDYPRSKPYFKKWSEDAKRRSGGKSLGNVREMHGLAAVGKLTMVSFDDENERILVRGKVVDPLARTKCEEGVYTGLSIGGEYGEALPDQRDPRILRYVAKNLREVSLVDDPSNPDATFELTGADGSIAVKKFARAGDLQKDADCVAMIDAAIDSLQNAKKAVQAVYAAKGQLQASLAAAVAQAKDLAGASGDDDAIAVDPDRGTGDDSPMTGNSTPMKDVGGGVADLAKRLTTSPKSKTGGTVWRSLAKMVA